MMDEKLLRELQPSEVAIIVKSIREGLRCFGQPADDMTDEQLAVYAKQVQRGMALAGINVDEFVRSHIALLELLKAEKDSL